jgi:hypothetical protein
VFSFVGVLFLLLIFDLSALDGIWIGCLFGVELASALK